MLLSVPLLSPSPEHHSAFRIVRHRLILGGLIPEVTRAGGAVDPVRGPSSDIVPASIHAVHNNMLVSARCEVLLHRLIGAVGVADEDRAPSLHEVVELVPQGFVQLRDCSRPTNEYAGHRFFRV